MKKKIVLATGLFLVLSFAFVIVQPYLTINEIRTAANAYDADKLNHHIDFVSVRASLKEQLNRKLAKEISDDGDISNPFVMLGTVFASSVIDRMVDNYITPAGIAEMLEGRETVVGNSKQRKSNVSAEKANTKNKEEPKVVATYQSANTFSVMVGEGDQAIEFILRRKGLSWRLSNIVLP